MNIHVATLVAWVFPFTTVRHCEERVRGLLQVCSSSRSFAGQERVRSQTKLRSNLISLLNWREFFKVHVCKITSPQTQCDEIASWMQQCLTELVRKLSLAETRNDEINDVSELENRNKEERYWYG
jgi:hypothetical protein